MSHLLEVLENNVDSFSRRRFMKAIVGASAAIVAWAAGARDAFASCGITIGATPGYSHCNPACSPSLHALHCCCLIWSTACSGGLCNCANCSNCCSGGGCSPWAWYCTDCDLKDWECMECYCGCCSAANYLGRRPAA
jgi:hypothetical protein